MRPAKLQALAEEAADALDDPRVNLDSQVDLLRSLRRAGLPVTSTRRHELRRHDHPAVAPLIRYRELARLQALRVRLSAEGRLPAAQLTRESAKELGLEG